MMKKFKKINLNLLKLLPAAAAILVLIVLAVGYLYLHHYQHRSDVKPNDAAPTTGVSLVFNPPLKNTAKLEIEDSTEKTIKIVNLVKADSKTTSNSISNPLGIRYNVSLGEGVYRVKVTGSDFPPFISTVTVTNHKLTTESVSFAGIN